MHKALIVVGVIVAFNIFIGIVFLRMTSRHSRDGEKAKEFEREAVIFPKRKSKDLVRYSSSSGGNVEFDVDQYTSGIKASMMRTRAEVVRIERALNQIKGDKYYRVIELKYFEKKDNQEEYSYDEIAEIMSKDEKTIRRNKSRLVNKLKFYLFGAEALTKLT